MKITNREWAKVDLSPADSQILREATKIIAATIKAMEDNCAVYAHINQRYFEIHELDDVKETLDEFTAGVLNEDGTRTITLESED